MDQEARERFENTVKDLEGLGHRGSATEKESQAADYVKEQFEASGIPAVKEPFYGCNALGARILVHIASATISLLLVWYSPILALIISVVTLVSFYGEMNTKFFLLGRLLPRHISHNVAARIAPLENSALKHRIILCAHMDTQRTGLMWKGSLVEPLARLYQKAPGPMKSPVFPVVLAFFLTLVLSFSAVLGTPNEIFKTLFWVSLFILAIAGFLLLEWATGRFVPGACDNASGTAAVMELAREWAKKPEKNIELVALVTGCEETGALGAAAWLDSHQEKLEETSNIFLVVDTLGYGGPRVPGKEHSLFTNAIHYPPHLLKLALKTASRLGLEKPGPYNFPTFSDGLAFVNRKMDGLAILTFNEDVTMPNFHQMSDTSENMDFDIGWKAVEFCWEVLNDIRADISG